MAHWQAVESEECEAFSFVSELSCCLAGNLIVFGCDSIGDFCGSSVTGSLTDTSKISLVLDMPLSESGVAGSSLRHMPKIESVLVLLLLPLLSILILLLVALLAAGGLVFVIFVTCCFGAILVAVGVVSVTGGLADRTVGDAVSTLNTLKFDPFNREGRAFSLTIGTTVALSLTQLLKLLMVVNFCIGCMTLRHGVRFTIGIVLILSPVIVVKCGTNMFVLSGGFGVFVCIYVKFGGNVTAVNVTGWKLLIPTLFTVIFSGILLGAGRILRGTDIGDCFRLFLIGELVIFFVWMVRADSIFRTTFEANFSNGFVFSAMFDSSFLMPFDLI